MRSREQVEREWEGRKYTSLAIQMELFLEVLLDVRDLLQERKENNG